MYIIHHARDEYCAKPHPTIYALLIFILMYNCAFNCSKCANVYQCTLCNCKVQRQGLVQCSCTSLTPETHEFQSSYCNACTVLWLTWTIVCPVHILRKTVVYFQGEVIPCIRMRRRWNRSTCSKFLLGLFTWFPVAFEQAILSYAGI